VRHDKLFFCIGDVSGKGVPAALVMATMRSLFRSVTSHEERAAKIVADINNTLAEQNDQNMFVTLFVGVLDLPTGELSYCNAGHNAPLIIRAEHGEVRTMDVQPNLPVGISLGYAYVEQKMQLSYGDTLFLYTDGLTEAENIRHEQFGEQRMEQALNASLALRPREIVDAMDAQVAAFVGEAEQSDDLTLMAVRYQKPAIIMRNDIQQIPTLAEWVDELGIPMELNMPINLALEEAVSNVMLYAYPGRNDGKVFVEFAKAKDEQGEKLIFTISDSGIPFDPTAKPEADITLSAEERAIGGLGIHLVRKLMDEIRYERQDGKNILTLVKILNQKS
jgi:sigma-B regulation protein RsbU (phosphoserine phosphatase)